MEKIVMPLKSTVCAIIVTYFPNQEFFRNLSRIQAIVNEIVIVDNGSNNISDFETLFQQFKSVSLIKNEENLGMAALNQGTRFAIDNGYSWAIIFDQDSLPDKSILKWMKSFYCGVEDKKRIAVIGSLHSNYSDSEKELSSDGVDFGLVNTVIGSGSLIDLDAIKKIGPFREGFFIDVVDNEFCLRAWEGGYQIYQSKQPLMFHRLGNISEHRFFFRRFRTTNHSPLRRYYRIRNNTILFGEYLFKKPKWVIYTMFKELEMVFCILLFEKEKYQKIKMVILGVYDGILKREGKRRE